MTTIPIGGPAMPTVRAALRTAGLCAVLSMCPVDRAAAQLPTPASAPPATSVDPHARLLVGPVDPKVEAAAEGGDLHAQLELALRYSVSFPGMGEDEPLATYWYQRAAAQGDVGALMRLGSRAGGGLGMPRSPELSVAYYRRAGELGQPEAMYKVAMAYAAGRGVPADPAQSLAWHLRAGAAKYPASVFLAGDACLQGVGTAVDERRALVLYLVGTRMMRDALAASPGFTEKSLPADLKRGDAIARLHAELGDSAYAEALAAAQAWHQGQPLP